MDISFPAEAGQLAISLELLLLFRWLVENEPEKVIKLVEHASKNGFSELLASKKTPRNFADVTDQIDLHICVADFFSLLELALHRNAILAEELVISGSPVSPTINQIDMQNCDNETVALSVRRATVALKKGTSKNAKETLCKELLKNWRPHTEIH